VNDLVAALAVEDLDLRQSAARELADIGGRRVRRALVNAFREATAGHHREALVEAMRRTYDHELIGVFIDLAADVTQSETLRVQAVAAIGELMEFADRRPAEMSRAQRVLAETLDEGSADLRYWASHSLGRLRATGALPELERVAASDSREAGDGTGWGTVRDEARAAIVAIETGRFPAVPQPRWPISAEVAKLVAARVQVLIDDPEVDEELRTLARESGGLPVYVDAGGCLAIHPEGSVISKSWEPGGWEVERDPRWTMLAVVAGCEEYPELMALLPPVPEGAMDCEVCGGTGRVTETNSGGPMCANCWGLGWTELTPP
jgi:hypothetical protein